MSSRARSISRDAEFAKFRISMASQIVSNTKVKGGADYQFYAGASLNTALKIANIIALYRAGLIPKKLLPYVKLYLIQLDQTRKAEFASIGSDILSKLGFILGDPRESIRADQMVERKV